MNNKENIEKEKSKTSPEEEKAISEDVQKLAPLKAFEEKDKTEEGVKFAEKKDFANIAKEIPSSIRDYINTYITLADAKAGFLLGIAIGLLAATYVSGPQIFKINYKAWTFFEVLALVGNICLILAIYFAVVAVFPRTSTSRKKGFFSWVHIANYKDGREYLQNLSSASEGQIVEELFELNYDLSVICKRKYVWLSRAFKMSFAGFIICTVVLAFFSK